MNCDNCPFISDTCWQLCYVGQDIEVSEGNPATSIFDFDNDEP